MAFIEEVCPSLPPSFSPRAHLCSLHMQVVGRAYDFIYIRCDYSTGNNVGCASLLVVLLGHADSC